VELLEVGPTLRGADREARTLAVKSYEEAAPDELTKEIAFWPTLAARRLRGPRAA